MPNLPDGFDAYYLSRCQNHKDDCANFCEILRKAELYNIMRDKNIKVVEGYFYMIFFSI